MFIKLLKSATKQAARYQNSEMPTDKTRHGVKWYTSPLQHHRAPRRSNQPVLSCQFKGKSWEVSAYITNRCSREGWDQHNVWKSAQRWKQQNPIFKIFIPTSWIHSGRVYYHIQGWKSHPLDSWQKCSQAYKKKKLIPKFHGYLWMPVYVHMQMCFCFRVPVFEIPGRLGRQ